MLQNSFLVPTSPVATKNHNNQVQHSTEAHGHCYSDTFQEGSNQGGSTSLESIHFLPISSGESPVQGRISTNYQPETLEQICRRMVLQNGGSSSSLFFDTTERFHDETRSQGRILFSPSSPRVPQIPTLCVQRENIRFPMSPIRVEISPSSLHQANDSSHSPYPEFGNTNCHLPGRYSHLTSGSQCSTIYLQEGCEPSGGTGIPHQPEQMFSVPISAAYLLGNNAQHCHNVPVLADREAGSHPTGSTPATYQRQEYTTGVGSTPGKHEPCSSEWHLVGSSALQSTSEVHSAGTLRYGCKGSQQSLDLSREAMKDVEWWLSQEPRNTNTHHLRCPPFDLVIHTDASILGWGGGGNSRQHLHRGTLEPRGVTATYQCTGAQSSISCNPGFHKESEITTG